MSPKMENKKLKTLDDSQRPDGTSDVDWNTMKKGYKKLQLTLMNLADEIGADYYSDVGIDLDDEKGLRSDKNS